MSVSYLSRMCEQAHRYLSHDRYIPYETIDEVCDSVLSNCVLEMGASQVSLMIGQGIDIFGLSFVLEKAATVPIMINALNSINKAFAIPQISSKGIDVSDVLDIFTSLGEISKQVIQTRFKKSRNTSSINVKKKIEQITNNYIFRVNKGAQIYAISIAYVDLLSTYTYLESQSVLYYVEKIKKSICDNVELYYSYIEEFCETYEIIKFDEILSLYSFKEEDNSVDSITAELKADLERSIEEYKQILLKEEEIIRKRLDHSTILTSFETSVLNQDLARYISLVRNDQNVNIRERLPRHIKLVANFLYKYSRCKILFAPDPINVLNKYLEYCLLVKRIGINLNNEIISAENLTLYACVKELPLILNWRKHKSSFGHTIVPDYALLIMVGMMVVELESLNQNDISDDKINMISGQLISNFIKIFTLSNISTFTSDDLEREVLSRYPYIQNINQFFPTSIQKIVSLCEGDFKLLMEAAFLHYCWDATINGDRPFNFRNEFFSIIDLYYNRFKRFVQY